MEGRAGYLRAMGGNRLFLVQALLDECLPWYERLYARAIRAPENTTEPE